MSISRRKILGLLAVSTLAHPVYAKSGALIPIRDTRLYVETAGASNAPPLLYLHGGPGASCYDFSVIQSALLSPHVRLIMFDQRGVLRSDAIGDQQSCTLHDLIEDIESLRLSLGISRWSVLGHSFGGYCALLYASRYPHAVDKLIFENPTFDSRSTYSETLLAASREFMKHGDAENAAAALKASVDQPSDDQDMLRQFDIVFKLGQHRNNLYFHGSRKDWLDTIYQGAGFPREFLLKAGRHLDRLFAEGEVLKPRLDALDELAAPALLIKGVYDCVTAPVQIERFLLKPGRSFVPFATSSHFCRIEEPERYARTVADFVLP